MKRVKKPKTQKIPMTAKELDAIRKEVTEEAVGTASLLYMTAMKDEFGYEFEEVERVFVRATRYARYIEEHVASMKDLAKTLEKDTGIKIKWR